MKKNRIKAALAVAHHGLVRHWRGLLWIVGILGGFVLLVLSVQWWMRAIGDNVSGWWSKIEDPTERGGAYIATAIAAHALVMAFKSMSHDRIKGDVKKDD